jgi:hypothetical protein
MTKYTEIDFDNPVHWKRQRRRPPPPLEGEILTPEPEQPTVHVVHHYRRHGPTPQRLVIIAAFAVLALVLLRSPGALVLLAVMIPSWVWLALGVIVAVLVLVSVREHRAGRDF